MSTNDAAAAVVPVRAGIAKDTALPFSSHLVELRKSLIISAAALALMSIAAYAWVDPILRDMTRPVGKLYFLSPTGAFMTKLKVAVFAGAFLSAPVIFYELWSFVRRGLFPHERKAVLLLTGVSLLLFFSGALFCYVVVLPAGVRFLMGYGSDVLVPFISVTHYLSFVFRMVLSFGLVFELPLAMWFLVRAGVVDPGTLRRNRRIAVVLAFIAAAVLTPTTDVFNQLLMAGPLVLLYEAGILAARISEKRGAHGKDRTA